MGFVMQIVHSTFTNLVYYFENKYMTGAQRMPLYDIGFDLFPTLTGTWWLFSGERRASLGKVAVLH